MELEDGCRQLGLAPGEDALYQLNAYLDMLLRWNRAYNLTAIRDRERMVSHHLLDSLAISGFLQGDRFIDVGTGAGLPGVPLAILNPDKSFTLLDSNGKKTRFLCQLKAQLGIANITVLQHRVEVLVDQSGFDMVLSRAFASLSDMLRVTWRLPAADGRWLAMKGGWPGNEIGSLPPGIEPVGVYPLDVPGLSAPRHVAVLQRINKSQ